MKGIVSYLVPTAAPTLIAAKNTAVTTETSPRETLACTETWDAVW